MALKVAFHTLGCKLNYSETSTIANQFLENGFSIVDFKEDADVYVLNTCTVTESAEKECRQLVRRVLRQNPNAFIAVTGCYAQLRPEEISSIEGVDAVLGSHEKFKILSLFDDFNKKNLSCIYVTPIEKLEEFNSSFSTETIGRTRAYFKVQDGCDYKCTFCTIPLARGKSRSMQTDSVVEQFSNFLANGYKEIILTGVNVGDYGKNLGTDFYSLLKTMLTIEGDYRIRISSIEPNLLTDDILNLVQKEKRLCNHFHIPLQSGSREVLRLMQRRYTKDYYRELILKVVDKIPNAGIGVDVIVGFPGETEELFLETYDFLKELPIGYLHVFTYSERPDTKAINMSGIVDVAERKKRNNMLRILSEKKKNEFYRRNFGIKERALFEHENHDGFMFGWTDNYIRVKDRFNKLHTNSFVSVQIDELDSNICNVKNFNNKLINAAG
ncbi:MAG: tRNA (N(6)-L-threonylcarbamoyladenosine(37)-C(2))-methylthiotransferase MtaB [Ignavibacteriae bacterium HGW-Ignavibacteriae-2]|nr:MAG: tRNA (N(6)-L-threonylcarbamoyladenosine(37)-C(2))-methylthiotransferase MtaB [Ignavibacteriae bacterium HGW-Ignavibacteriae-2]